MFFAIPGLKAALLAAGAVGVGAAVVSHWEDIKIIIENFDEVRQSLTESIDHIRQQNERKKKACAMESGSSHDGVEDLFCTPDIAYSSNYDDKDLSDDTLSGQSIRHRRHKAETEGNQDAAGDGTESMFFETSQLSMPSSHTLHGSELPTDTDTDLDDQSGVMSEFSIISSDEEYP